MIDNGWADAEAFFEGTGYALSETVYVIDANGDIVPACEACEGVRNACLALMATARA